jgi:hypothetical protein
MLRAERSIGCESDAKTRTQFNSSFRFRSAQFLLSLLLSPSCEATDQHEAGETFISQIFHFIIYFIMQYVN